MKLSPFLERRLRALQSIAAADRPLASRVLPGVRLRGSTNGSQGVTRQGQRGRRARQRGLRSTGENSGAALNLKSLFVRHGPLVVLVTRVAPNRLDGDNLEASMKRLRDGLAAAIGIDDRKPDVEYVPNDERGAVREYALRFEVFSQVRGLNVVPTPGDEPAQTTFSPRSPTPNVQKPRTKLDRQLERMRNES